MCLGAPSGAEAVLREADEQLGVQRPRRPAVRHKRAPQRHRRPLPRLSSAAVLATHRRARGPTKTSLILTHLRCRPWPRARTSTARPDPSMCTGTDRGNGGQRQSRALFASAGPPTGSLGDLTDVRCRRPDDYPRCPPWTSNPQLSVQSTSAQSPRASASLPSCNRTSR